MRCQEVLQKTRRNNTTLKLKKASKEKQEKLFTAAGMKQPKIPSDDGSALRTSMELSWNKYRKQRRYFRSIGVEMDSERAERNFQEDALCGQITVEDIPLNHGNTREPIPTPVGYVKELPKFV